MPKHTKEPSSSQKTKRSRPDTPIPASIPSPITSPVLSPIPSASSSSGEDSEGDEIDKGSEEALSEVDSFKAAIKVVDQAERDAENSWYKWRADREEDEKKK